MPSLAWIYLSIAIVCEVIATASLKASNGMTVFWPSVWVVVGYGVAFYCLSLTLKTLPMGIAYAVWSGVGIALITLVGWVVYQQHLSIAALCGLILISAGVVLVTVGSNHQPI